MANFQGHITTSSVLGVAVGDFGAWYFNYDWGTVFLAAGLTAIGGMLPDLDSDSGIPVRELFGLAGVHRAAFAVRSAAESRASRPSNCWSMLARDRISWCATAPPSCSDASPYIAACIQASPRC